MVRSRLRCHLNIVGGGDLEIFLPKVDLLTRVIFVQTGRIGECKVNVFGVAGSSKL